MKAFVLSCVILLCAAGAARAQDSQPENAATISVMLENDSFIHHIDRHYTNGLYFSWAGPAQTRDDWVTGLAASVMLPATSDDPHWRTGTFAGQSMFTPENLSARIPPANDRPYAGWLYGGARLWRDSGDVLDRVDVTLGIVGPASLASDLQRSWHGLSLLGGITPNGWHTQLRDEPGLVLGEQRIWRVGLLEGPLEAEILPQIDASLGNVFTYAGAGAMLRIGEGLKADWGPPRIAPALGGADFQAAGAFGWYVFGGLQGRAVARNLFLNGNSFEDSPRVSSHPLVGDFSAGAAILWPAMRLMATYTNRSREFTTQNSGDKFVSVTLSFSN